VQQAASKNLEIGFAILVFNFTPTKSFVLRTIRNGMARYPDIYQHTGIGGVLLKEDYDVMFAKIFT
jgi:hypothetical protein